MLARLPVSTKIWPLSLPSRRAATVGKWTPALSSFLMTRRFWSWAKKWAGRLRQIAEVFGQLPGRGLANVTNAEGGDEARQAGCLALLNRNEQIVGRLVGQTLQTGQLFL